MELNTYEEIVMNFSSPTLVLAGPGAGKTYLLADRVKRLLDMGTDKNRITVLTFSVDAKNHMKEELTNQKEKFKLNFDELPNISTMHSLGLEIVKKKPGQVHLRKTGLKVQENEEIKKLMYRDSALILNYTEEDSKEAVKCKQVGDCRENSMEKKCIICLKYHEIMSKCNHIDFDDQVIFACKILENNPDILDEYQCKSTHLLIDEYQDINAAQFRLIELLSRKCRNGLFVVGDDAQSIYGFRGCSPDFILRFEKYFPETATGPLAHSRRCHRNITKYAIKVLQRHYVNWTGNKELEYHVQDGNEPYVWQLPSDKAEAKMVAKISFRYLRENKKVLILVPKKELFPNIIKSLSKFGIKHDCNISFLPERIKIVKLLLDWANSPADNFTTRLVIEQLINKGVAHVAGADKDRRSSPETIRNRIAQEKIIAELWECVDRKNDLFSIIQNLDNLGETLQKIKDSMIKILDTYGDFKRDKKGEFVKQVSLITGIWNDPKEFAEDINSITEALDEQDQIITGFVGLKTMRKSKGLEADVVIIVGAEDDIVPNPIGDIIEEARLFYVSMTRAKEKVFILHAFKRPRNISYGDEIMNKNRSRFLDAIGIRSDFKQ